MKKILVGCGIASLVSTLLLVGGGLIVGNWVKGQFKGVEQLEEMQADLAERFGAAEDYIPALDGLLDPDRIEMFIRLREDLKIKRSVLAAEADEIIQNVKFQQDQDRGPIRKLLDTIEASKQGLAVLKNGFVYLQQRTQALGDIGMGEGEYSYLYSLATFSWLSWDPVRVFGEEALEEYDMEDGADAFRSEYRKTFLRQLKNLRRALQDQDMRTEQQEKTLAQVDDAIAVALDNRGQFPFEGALPKEWLEILAPYRDRFTATLPESTVEFVVEAVATLEDDDDDGFQIKIGD